ncbi:hypothetical protein QG37_04758 [Candidozyma auris]|uniref:Uncharacterized protein n=1 Tax=Candidozyma auris TaxID=498019 RepID=A0A0L0NW73_CANAR|nr:hypothetical protein QG37_04758 [[Candida] auris]
MHNGHVKKTQDKGEASEGKGNGETSPGKKRWGGEGKEMKKKKWKISRNKRNKVGRNTPNSCREDDKA